MEEDRIPPTPRRVRIIRAIIGMIAIGGLLYLSGIQQYFFLRRTPPAIEQPVLASKVEAPVIVVPVEVHILVGALGSGRTEDDTHRLVEQANNIWAQANISFVITAVHIIPVDARDLSMFDSNPHAFIEASERYNPQAANMYLTRTLRGVNGLAYGGTSAVSVADYTSRLDFRTVAHEFGHLLGLPHTDQSGRLMVSGGSGVVLTSEEITVARQNARVSFGE